jgi:hypothetical protein
VEHGWGGLGCEGREGVRLPSAFPRGVNRIAFGVPEGCEQDCLRRSLGV